MMLMNERFVAVFPSLVRLLGSLESAVILQHLHFSADEAGDIKITRQQVSDETGIAFATVTRRLSWLRDEGWVESRRASRSDSTQIYRVCMDKIRESQPATPGGDEVAVSESRNLQLSSLQKGRTTTTRASKSNPIVPSRHPSRGIEADWEPRPEWVEHLAVTYPHVDLGVSQRRFTNHYFAKQETSKSWEARLENWVSLDQERAEREILVGTDDLGVPRTQGRTSIVGEAAQPGDPDYIDQQAYLADENR